MDLNIYSILFEFTPSDPSWSVFVRFEKNDMVEVKIESCGKQAVFEFWVGNTDWPDHFFYPSHKNAEFFASTCLKSCVDGHTTMHDLEGQS